MFDWIPTLVTQQLVLRERTAAIVQRIFNEYDEAAQLLFFNLSSVEELAVEKERLEKGYHGWSQSFIVWDLIERTTGKNIGFCGFHAWHIRHDRAEIGYALSDESAKRKGYMSEAVARVIQYGFEGMNLHRIEAFDRLVYPS